MRLPSRGKHSMDSVLHVVGGLREFRRIGGIIAGRLARQIVPHRIGSDEIAIGQPLHEGARAEAVCAVVGEIRLSEHEQAGDVAHQVVIDPQTAHGVVDGRVDPHGHLIGVLARDLLIHVEKVAVALLHQVQTQTLDGVREIEIDAKARIPDAAPLVARSFRRARGDVSRREVPETRVHALEVIIPLILRNLTRTSRVPFLQRHPDAAVVSQGFGHEREFRLMIPRNGYARGVNLRVAGIREISALHVRA